MKKCRRCGADREISEFYTHAKMHDGHLNICKPCIVQSVKEHRATHANSISEYEAKRSQTEGRKQDQAAALKRHREKNPERYKARNAVSNAIRDGKISRGSCVHCGTDKRVEAHHADYSKPLEVTWVCFWCHRAHEHGQNPVQHKPT
jgi:hypothetical protein